MPPDRSSRKVGERVARSRAKPTAQEKRGERNDNLASAAPTGNSIVGKAADEGEPEGEVQDPKFERFMDGFFEAQENIKSDHSKNRYHERPAYDGTVGWPTFNLEKTRRLVWGITYGIQDWAEEFCVEDPEVFEKEFSSEDRKDLIGSLEGYCRQMSWSSLIDQVGRDTYAYECLPSIIASTILAKSIWEDVVKDPFFFLGDGPAPMPPGDHSDLFVPSKPEVHNMWRWCQRVDSYHSCIWRRLTVHHLIETSRLSESSPPGLHIVKLRDEAIEYMAKKILSPSGTLSRLLKDISDPGEEERRWWKVVLLCRDAEQLSYGIHAQDYEYRFHRFGSPPAFSPGMKNVEPSCSVHNGESEEKQAQKHRLILFQFRPGLTYTWGKRHERNREKTAVLWPANVALSDHSLSPTLFG